MDIARKRLLKKICTISLAAAVLTGGAAVASQVGLVQTGISVNAAETLVRGDYRYEIADDNTIMITAYQGSDENVTVPSKIDGKAVTEIEPYAFYNFKNIKSITISEGIKTIDVYSFIDCTALKSITIPSSVTSLDSSAFSGCTALTDISISKDNQNYSFDNGVLFNKDKTKLLYCVKTKKGAYTIPDSVTEVNNGAFSGCTGLTSISMSDSVTSISNSAFSDCTALTSISLSKNATQIAENAFLNCTALKSITIPDSVTSIGQGAFLNTGLTSITIPANVTSIGMEAFGKCASLTNITVNKNNTVYSSKDGALFNKEQTELLYCPTGKQGTYTIPNGVTSIDYAFSGCTGLTNVVIPDSIETIGFSAFAGCTGLTSVTIPNSVTLIDSSAFNCCTGLTSIIIPDSVNSIGTSAFYGCTGLTRLTIGNSVTSISNEAFSGCTGLTSIIFPDSMESINYSAFYGCTGLKSVTIPENVKLISTSAFSYCTSLTNISVSEKNDLYSSEDGVLFNKDKTRIECCPGGKKGVYVIPNSVTDIDYYAFAGCKDLTSITIPKSVTFIGSYAFSGCKSLTNITLPDSLNSMEYSVFYNCTGLKSIAIPESITSIKSYTFSGCTGLTSITIPKSVTFIGYGAFSECTGLTIYGAKDSYAEQYAKNNNIKFEELVPPLENTCSVSAESIVLGNKITLKGAATGGKGPYTYAYYYKKTTDKKWVTAKGFSNTTSVSIKPAMAKDYDICIKVKDATGKSEKKYFTVKVSEKLAIKASVSAENLKLGNQLTLIGAATGGSGDYTYAYYYKKTTDKKWVTAKGFSNITSVTIKPAMAKDYEVCIKVKDSTGATQKQYFTVKVTN